MTISNLHDAAEVLEGALSGIDRLLDETEPMERVYHQQLAALYQSGGVNAVDLDARSESSGYSRFYGAVMRLAEVQRRIDQLYFEEVDLDANGGPR